MGAKEHMELLKTGYEAFSKGDLDTVRERFAPDIRWHIPGRSQLAGTYDGIDEVFGFFGKLIELTAGTFTIEIHDMLGSDDHVVVLAKESGDHGDQHLDSNEVHVWHITEDGKAKEFWGIPEDQYAVDAFFG